MSGLCAIARSDGSSIDPAMFAAVLDRLEHRGGDGRGEVVLGNIALGHVLFATTPEDSLERQPLSRPAPGGAAASGGALSQSHTIVADARIDNRAELARELDLPLAEAARASDAQLILRAYARWGEQCASKLTGDYAFAVWDGPRRQLFCARDAMGVRPLYYHAGGSALRCASEMHALFADATVPRRPHELAMALFLTDRYTERDQTLYEGVFALPAGHTLRYRDGALDVQRFWRPDPWREIRYASDEQYAEHFREVFAEAVRCRLRTTGRTGAIVSGGLDSSSVVCEAERLRRDGAAPGDPLLMLHLAFPGLGCDEAAFSRAVAERWDLQQLDSDPAADPGLCRPDPATVERDVYFHPTVEMFTPLFADARRRGVRVTLTGVGGDDLMEGTDHDCEELLSRGDLRGAAEVVGLTDRPMSRATWRNIWSYGIRPFVPDSLRRARRRLAPPGPPWVPRRLACAARDHREDDVQSRARRAYPGPVARALHEEIMSEQGDNPVCLARLDRYAARRGMELRHPFYDVRVVELLLSFPQEQRARGSVLKPVLRRAMKGSLPPLVQNRRDSAAFGGYIRKVLFDHRRRVRQLFQHSSLEERGIILGQRARTLLGAEAPLASYLPVIDLVALEIWLRQTTNRATPERQAIT